MRIRGNKRPTWCLLCGTGLILLGLALGIALNWSAIERWLGKPVEAKEPSKLMQDLNQMQVELARLKRELEDIRQNHISRDGPLTREGREFLEKRLARQSLGHGPNLVGIAPRAHGAE